MSKEEPWNNIKENITRFREPFRFKIKPYRYETKEKKVVGHEIEIEMNLSETDIDRMKNKDGPLLQGISNCKWIIEHDLESIYLGALRKDTPI